MYDSVFISYRREGSSTVAGMLYDELCKAFPKGGVFRDTNAIAPGSDFRKVIDDNIEKANVVLVLIDRNWLRIKGKSAKKRLFEEEDFIRHEIRSAIQKAKILMPVLYDGGKMPKPAELPDDIRELCNSQAFTIDPDKVMESIGNLIEVIRKMSNASLSNTLTGTLISLKENPKATFKKLFDGVVDLGKREMNVLDPLINRKKKKN